MQVEEEQRVRSLANGCLVSLHTDTTPPGIAELAQQLFPAAAALRINVVTGDPQVLASVGSLLTPGPLALALLPLHASAAGAAVVRQAPIFLAEEGRHGLACYDFEGSAVFCLPIVRADQPIAAAAAQPRCLGALLLSFASPAQLDAAHARNLLLLARAVAPGLLRAAAQLLQQCALILGVQPHAAASGEGQEEVEGSVYWSDSEAEEEGGLPPVWEEEEAEAAALSEEEEALRQQQQQQQVEWAAGSCRDQPPEPPDDPGSASAALAVQPERGAQSQTKAEVAAAAGERTARRSGSAGSSMAAPAAAATAALVAAPPSPTAVASRIASFETTGSFGTPRSPSLLKTPTSSMPLEAQQAVQPAPSAQPAAQPPTSPQAAAVGRSRLSVEGPRPAEPPASPESPSVLKARAKAAAGGAAFAGQEAGATEGASTSAGPDTRGSPGPAFSASPLLKVSPAESDASVGSAASATLAREAGSSLLRLLRFEDAALEARFARWLHAQLWRTDLLSMCLAVSLQLTLLCTTGSGGASLPWAALQWATVLVPLALLLGWRRAYLRHRDLIMALWYLSCGCWRLCTAGIGSTGFGAAGTSNGGQGGWQPWLGPLSLVAFGMGAQLCSLAACMQSRLCVQAPLQGLLFATHTPALLRSHCGAASGVVQAFALTVLLPLTVLYKLEMEARRAFMVRLPLLPPELPPQPPPPQLASCALS